MKKFILTTVIAILSLLLLSSCDNSSTTEKSTQKKDSTVKWKMAATFPSNLNIIGEGGVKQS